MSILPIRLYPDPVLRARCREVEEFDSALVGLVADMVETMHAAPGIGLAAPQVGVDRRIAVVDLSVGESPEALLVLINPRIVEQEGSTVDVEGCLSLPGITEKVERPTRVVIEASHVDGEAFSVEVEDWLARAICHELDHLDGVLFTDRLSGLKKDKAKRALKRLVEEQQGVLV
ncbi:MAG TPA: peptide deformylase [Thermoanaerobaculia bacterium]|jgi:peptide deformylase|nr:peptide deformylase [Thermoanaerobaculia bacterium]